MPSTAVFVDLARAAFGTLILSVPHVCSIPPVTHAIFRSPNRSSGTSQCQDLKQRPLYFKTVRDSPFLSSRISSDPEKTLIGTTRNPLNTKSAHQSKRLLLFRHPINQTLARTDNSIRSSVFRSPISSPSTSPSLTTAPQTQSRAVSNLKKIV